MLQGLFDVASLSFLVFFLSLFFSLPLHLNMNAAFCMGRMPPLHFKGALGPFKGTKGGRGVGLVLSDPNAQGRCSPVVVQFERVESDPRWFLISASPVGTARDGEVGEENGKSRLKLENVVFQQGKYWKL